MRGKKAQTPKAAAKSELIETLEKVRGLEGEIAQVLRGMQEKVRQLELLSQFSRLLNSSLDPSIVREKALEATCQLLGCETASLLLIDEKTGELYWESALGEAGKQLQRSLRLPINDRSIAGYVAMTSEGLIINDVENDPRYYKKATEKTGFRNRTMLCVPVRTKGKTIGVLQALNKLSSVPVRASLHEWPDFCEDELRLFESLSNQVAIAVDNSRLYTSLKKSFFDTVEALAESIEKRDHYTGGHTKRVVYYSLCIAKYMSLTQEQLEQIRLSALLHDIGKIGIEDKVLKKQSKLDPEEWQVMKKHPELGYDIMCRVDGLRDVTGGMRCHHEHWDGSGYPLALKGEEIPLIARIIAVADTYDAMVSTRPYRKGLPPEAAFDEIVKFAGIQFDPMVVAAFVEAFKHEKMGKGSGGSSY